LTIDLPVARSVVLADIQVMPMLLSEHLVGAIQTVVDAPWPRTPRGPFITELFVAPRWRNRGIATNLVRQTLAAAYDLGFTSVGLRVDRDNTAARSLYSSIGFVDWHE